MIRYGIWVTFLLAVQLSSVLGRNQFYEYYYNKYHHKGHSSTTALSSSTAGISTEQKISSSVSGGDDSSESAEHSSTVDFELAKHKNKTSHSYGYPHRNNGASDAWLVIGIILLVCFVVSLLGCCCIKRCRRENKGFVLGSNVPEESRLLPENSLPYQAVLPDYTVPSQQYPPYYQSGPLMPPYFAPAPAMYQHSPVPQMQPDGVPATPPPPYDTTPYDAPSYNAPPPRK